MDLQRPHHATATLVRRPSNTSRHDFDGIERFLGNRTHGLRIGCRTGQRVGLPARSIRWPVAARIVEEGNAA